MRSDCQTRCTPLLGSCSCPLHAGRNVRLHPDNTRNTIANCLYPESPIPLSKTAIESVGRKRRYVRFARDGIEEVETSNSNSRTRFPYNSRFSNRAKINGFVCFCSFFSFFFNALSVDKETDWQSVQNKRGKQNLSKQFDNRGAGEGRLSSKRYQNFLLTWNLTWNLRLYTCPLTANFFSQK